MRSYVFSSPVPQLILSPDFRLLDWNQSFAVLFSGDTDQLSSITLPELIVPRNPGQLDTVYAELEGKPGSAASIPCRISIPGKTAETWYYLSIAHLDNSAYHCAFINANEQILEAETLERAKNAAEESTRSKSLFLANMSHEIRTPIHTVRGMSELLLDTALDEEQMEYAAQIHFSAEALLGLINDILDFSKIEAGKLHIEYIPFNLKELLSAVADMLSLEVYKRNLEFFLTLDAAMPERIMGDPNRLRQILVNLLSNAMKFTHNGHIELRLTHIKRDDHEIEYRIEVVDTGIGIAEEKQKSLFTSFQQVDSTTTRKYGGTGLGLAISRSLVQLMGGKIGFLSREHRGTTFWFTLRSRFARDIGDPVSERDQQSAQTLATAAISDHEEYLKDYRLLLVHRYAPAHEHVRKLIADQFISFTSAETGREGLAALRRLADEGDSGVVVLVDLQLEDMDGWQFASEVNSDRLINSNRLFLMRPPGAMQADAKMKLLNWFDGYIIKPLKLSQLMDQFSLSLDTGLDLLEIAEELDDEPPVEGTMPENPVRSDETATYSFLVADDHFVNQQLFKTILEKLGYSVQVASSGLEVLNILQKHADFDAIFLDIQMPEMDGYDAAVEIRKRGVAIPIIAVTANALAGERQRCIQLGMDDYMTKPFSRDDLVSMISRWAGKKRAQDTSIQDTSIFKAGDRPERTNREEATTVFDYPRALANFMGRKDVLNRVLKEFLVRTREDIENLARYVAGSDLKALRIRSHGIKGSSRNLAMHALGQAAEAIEEISDELLQSQDGDPIRPQPDLTGLITLLEGEFHRVSEAVNEAIGTEED